MAALLGGALNTAARAAGTATLTARLSFQGAADSTTLRFDPTSDPTHCDSSGSHCAQSYAPGTAVTVHVSPFSGQTPVVIGWSEAACGTALKCTVTVDADRAISVVLRGGPNLYLSNTGPGIGTITSDPPGVSCSGQYPVNHAASCKTVFPTGTPFTLTATPGADSVFDRWRISDYFLPTRTGSAAAAEDYAQIAACGSNPSCTITLHGPMNLEAVYSAPTGPTFTITKTGGGDARLYTTIGDVINCGTVCSRKVAPGKQLPIGIQVATGSFFKGWGGDATGCGQFGCTIVMPTTAYNMIVNLQGSQQAPTISWSDPAHIVYGEALGAAELNASANTPGSFTYDPPIGTVLDAGDSQTLTVRFTPDDASSWTTASASVRIDVRRAPLRVNAGDSSRVFGTANPELSGTLAGVVNGDDITATYSTTATSTSPVGTYSITPALVDPDGRVGNYDVTSSAGTLTVTSRATDASLSCSPSPATVNSATECTAYVSDLVAEGAGYPSGEVELGAPEPGLLSETACSLVPTAVSGVASCSVRYLPRTVSSQALSVRYLGDATYGASSAETTLSVIKAVTSTHLTASPNPSSAGQPVTLAAAVFVVSPQAAGSLRPTGEVTFRDGDIVLGSRSVNTVDGVTGAEFHTDSLSIGTHAITAAYSGDGLVEGGSVALEVVVIDTTPPTLSLPADITANPTRPDGAAVSYTFSATDPDDPVQSASCSTPSGSVFPIGLTTVTCTATDTAGNSSSASFTVTVRSADDLFGDLYAKAQSHPPGTALRDKVSEARGSYEAGDLAAACQRLDDFIALVKAQRGKKLTDEQAQDLTADARRIKTIIRC